MIKLTHYKLTRIFKRKNLDKDFTTALIRALESEGHLYRITTRSHVIRFLAQAVSETMVQRNGRVRTRESLNYSPSGLMRLSSYFRKNPHLARKYGRTKKHRANQVAIANIWYADKNRSKWLRLGNTQVGDGWTYRGNGLFQTTGRYNTERDVKTMERLSGLNLRDGNGDLILGVLDIYDIFVRLGMAYWYNNGAYNCNSTYCATQLVNRGLPNTKKKARTRRAVEISKIV